MLSFPVAEAGWGLLLSPAAEGGADRDKDKMQLY